MKFDIERGLVACGGGGNLTIRFEKGTDERAHGEEISSVRKSGF